MRHLVFILILVGSVTVGRWVWRQSVAVALIEWADDADSRDLALRYAPDNPAVIAARAKYLAYRAAVPDTEQGLAGMRRAVSLTPGDYRYWLELGRMAETHGDQAAAALALDRARSLAPRHFETHWTWANFKLRNGEAEEAIASFHRALLISENRPGVTNGRAALNVYDALTQSLGLDLRTLNQVAPPDEIAQSWLAWYLAAQGELDPALEIFRRLPRHGDGAAPELAAQLLLAAQRAGRYAEAGEVWTVVRRFSAAPEKPPAELVENGGFEEAPLTERIATLRDSGLGFDWVIKRHPEVVAVRDDDRPYRGGRSMQVSFPRAMTTPYAGLSQLILVEPGRSYQLVFHCRTQSLASETPWIEVVGLEVGAGAESPSLPLLRSSLPREAVEWQRVELTFAVPPGVVATRLVLRSPRYDVVDGLRRTRLWLDDLSLTPIGGAH
jgi:tetratricopeptide (TPR) repeat protein